MQTNIAFLYILSGQFYTFTQSTSYLHIKPITNSCWM